ncbi:MAG TPA: hypothetical protein VGV36_03770 [Solirubrobacteraceae bacterium]|nr:hypothetical protein [Solirubrobacteraceae bacterium]
MRPLFSPEATGAVIRGVRAGLTITEAAERAELSPQLVRNWLSRGRAEVDTDYSAFAIAVDAGREEAASAEVGEREFHERLARAVRSGSVQALRLWWTVHGQDRDEPRPEDELDALVARRDARRRASLDNGSGEGEAA